jgi:hypothetical protein
MVAVTNLRPRGPQHRAGPAGIAPGRSEDCNDWLALGVPVAVADRRSPHPSDGLAKASAEGRLLWRCPGADPGHGMDGRPRAPPTSAFHDALTPTATPAPSASGVPAALANLTAVATAARQQGTVDREAEDLLPQPTTWPTPSRRTQGPGQERQQGRGRRQGQRRGRGRGQGGRLRPAALPPTWSCRPGRGGPRRCRPDIPCGGRRTGPCPRHRGNVQVLHHDRAVTAGEGGRQGVHRRATQVGRASVKGRQLDARWRWPREPMMRRDASRSARRYWVWAAAQGQDG